MFLPVSTVFILGMVVIFNHSFHEKTAWCISADQAANHTNNCFRSGYSLGLQ